MKSVQMQKKSKHFTWISKLSEKVWVEYVGITSLDLRRGYLAIATHLYLG